MVTPLVVDGTFWVISQVTPLFWISLVSVTKNSCCSFVGTEAVTGVRAPWIPEISIMLALPLFFAS